MPFNNEISSVIKNEGERMARLAKRHSDPVQAVLTMLSVCCDEMGTDQTNDIVLGIVAAIDRAFTEEYEGVQP